MSCPKSKIVHFAHESYTAELQLSGLWLSGTPIIRTMVIQKSNYPEYGYPERQLSGLWLSGTPIIRTKVIRNSNYPDYYPERQLFGLWLSGTPIIRISLSLPVNIFIMYLYIF